MTDISARRLGLVDRWRRKWFTESLSLHLPDISQRDWRKLRRTLRNDLVDAAQTVGMKQAIADLGSVRRLADEYREALDLSSRPQWMVGAWAAIVAWVVLTVLLFTYATGMYHAAQSGGTTVGVARNFLGVIVDVGLDGVPFGMSFTLSSLIVPAFLVLVFLLTARTWRLAPRLRPSPKDR